MAVPTAHRLPGLLTPRGGQQPVLCHCRQRLARCPSGLGSEPGWRTGHHGAPAGTAGPPCPQGRAGVTTVTRRWGLSTEAARGGPGPGPRRGSEEPALAQTDAAAQAAKQAALLAQLSGVGGEGRGHRPTGSPGSAGHTTAGLSRDPEACLAGCLNGLTPLLLIHPRAQHRGGLGPKDSPWGFPRANALRLWQSSAPRLGLPGRQGRLGLSSDTQSNRGAATLGAKIESRCVQGSQWPGHHPGKPQN